WPHPLCHCLFIDPPPAGLHTLSLHDALPILSAEGVRLRFIGGRERLDRKLQRLMSGIEARTAGNSRLNFTIAINYGGRDEILRADRKSTRLNSSHVKISYAVFCLKKKNKQTL